MPTYKHGEPRPEWVMPADSRPGWYWQLRGIGPTPYVYRVHNGRWMAAVGHDATWRDYPTIGEAARAVERAGGVSCAYVQAW